MEERIIGMGERHEGMEAFRLGTEERNVGMKPFHLGMDVKNAGTEVRPMLPAEKPGAVPPPSP